MFRKKINWFKKQSRNKSPISLKVKVVDEDKVHKTIKKKKNKNIQAPQDQYFIVNNGSVLKDLQELQIALETMSDNQYTFHTKEHGNDFSNWIEKSLGNRILAKKISKCSSAQIATQVLKKYLA